MQKFACNCIIIDQKLNGRFYTGDVLDVSMLSATSINTR